MEVPRRKCLPVLRLWQSLAGSQWQRLWLARHHPRRYGLDKIDTRILPPHLSSKESLLLLSQWIRIPRDDLHIRHTTNSWLSPDKVKVALGPDCDLSPHPAREVPLNISTPYIDMLLGPRNLPEANLTKLPNKQRRIHFLLRKRCW